MTPHDIAHTLGTHSKSETSWLVKCPSHADKSPSLRITDKEGKMLVYCLAGCSFYEIRDELKPQGLWPEFKQDDREKYMQMATLKELDSARIWIAVFEGYEHKKTKADWAKYWLMRGKLKRN